MTNKAFKYLEICACLEVDGELISFMDEKSFEIEQSRFEAAGVIAPVIWTIYGRYADEAGQVLALAIGDFSTKEDAFVVMDAILAPLAKARDELAEANRNFSLDDPVKRRAYLTAIMDVHNDLDDFILQSSNRERL